MLAVDDICDDLDVLARDSTALSAFGHDEAETRARLRDKRTVAVMEWIERRLESAHFPPSRHSLRWAPSRAYGLTSSVWTDVTAVLGSDTTEDLDVSTVLVTPATDAVYVGFTEPFRGVYATMLDAVNTTPLSVSSWTFWNGGRWAAFNSPADSTFIASSISFSGGGKILWQEPTDWQKRPLGPDMTWRYWARVGMTAAPSSNTRLTSLLPIRRSRLTGPAVQYALGLLYSESWGAQRGEWAEKAKVYFARASEMLTEVLPHVADEFTAEAEEHVDPDSVNAVKQDLVVDPWSWERG